MHKFPFIILFLTFFPAIICTAQEQAPTSGFIKAGKLNVYYERAGKGDAILFLHAGLQDHTMWKEQVKNF